MAAASVNGTLVEEAPIGTSFMRTPIVSSELARCHDEISLVCHQILHWDLDIVQLRDFVCQPIDEQVEFIFRKGSEAHPNAACPVRISDRIDSSTRHMDQVAAGGKRKA